jgi:selenide,water dikinase
VLRQVLGALPVPGDPRLLAGFDKAEDAAVFRLDEDRAVVVTIDVITPLVDDPFLFGEIAAANALSDVYAMGGEPLFSLSFIGVPRGFPDEATVAIVRGGASLAKASGAPVVGGHSMESKDLMFGLAAVGLASPHRLFRNDALAVGDQLLLTKPLGTGALTTALKNDALTEGDLAEAIAGMRQTNRAAVAPCHALGVRAATDVTGFGLVGHAAEMASASSVRVVIDSASVPAYPHAREMLAKGHVTRADRTNLEYARELGPLEGAPEPLLMDPQTSGGLLVAVSAQGSEELVGALRKAGFPATRRVGQVREGAGIQVAQYFPPQLRQRIRRERKGAKSQKAQG